MFVFALTLLTSAGLLFLVEPLFAKRVLPVFGGTAAVWSSCMFFYQALLLAGYIYAHLLIKHLKLQKQIVLHLIVVALPLVLLIASLVAAAPTPLPQAQGLEDSPVAALLLYLLKSIGLPFFVLSSTAPLVQKWFSETKDSQARDPYFLYAASNLGSMVVLLGYPTVIEPALHLGDQWSIFVWGYVAFALLVSACAFKVRQDQIKVQVVAQVVAESDSKSSEETAKAITWRRYARWTFLAFLPSSLMLSVTEYLSTNIAPFPLLWTIPLALYLLTFIIVFARHRIVPQQFIALVQPCLLILLSVMFSWYATEYSFKIMFPLHLITFFFTALLCHGALAEDRPPVANLTSFYLCLSIGGALGGLFNAVCAPILFPSLEEYPLALILSCLVFTWSYQKKRDWQISSAVLAGQLLLMLLIRHLEKSATINLGAFAPIAMLGPAALMSTMLLKYPIHFALSIAAIFYAGSTFSEHNYLYQGRNFFGILKVEDKLDKYHLLIHGNIVHGVEDVSKEGRGRALSYYSAGSPVSQIFDAYNKDLNGKAVAAVGLGIGTLGFFAQPGQEWTFYEINPQVESVALNEKYFSFLANCKAKNSIVLGDARQSIALAKNSSYSMMIFDAFSSDAIPIHLITKEALALYLTKLAPHGVMVFNITSRSVNLEPLLHELCKSLNLVCLVQQEAPSTKEALVEMVKDYRFPSKWAILARNKEDLDPLITNNKFQSPDSLPDMQVWTDDYSNILRLIKLH